MQHFQQEILKLWLIWDNIFTCQCYFQYFLCCQVHTPFCPSFSHQGRTWQICLASSFVKATGSLSTTALSDDMFVIITSWRIVVCERNVGTEVRLQTGTYAAFSAPGQYGPKLYWPGVEKLYIYIKLGRATVWYRLI